MRGHAGDWHHAAVWPGVRRLQLGHVWHSRWCGLLVAGADEEPGELRAVTPVAKARVGPDAFTGAVAAHVVVGVHVSCWVEQWNARGVLGQRSSAVAHVARGIFAFCERRVLLSQSYWELLRGTCGGGGG